MITGYYSGLSGIYYNEQKLDAVANNVANANTPGFRRALMVMKAREQAQPESGRMHRAVAERVPTTYGIDRIGVFKNYEKTGRLQATNNPMDIAIPSELHNAFFAVQKAGANDGKVYYTRNGSLSIGKQNPSNPNSASVLYISGQVALNEGGQPIDLDPSRGPLAINASGQIYQGDEEVGQLPIYRFNQSADPTRQVNANLQLLEQKGDSLFEIPDRYRDQFHPSVIRVGENGVNQVVAQGMRESSNVSVFQEMTEMINVKQIVQANKTAMNFQMDGLQKLFQTVRG